MNPEKSAPWIGRWGWVSYNEAGDVDIDQSRFVRTAGLVDQAVFGLPPNFVAAMDFSGLLERINCAVGSMLDVFEDEDISGSDRLHEVAALVGQAEWPIEHIGLARELQKFLTQAAENEASLNFWL